MKVQLYTLYDVEAEECAPIFQAKNDQVALRMYGKAQAEQQFDTGIFQLLYVGSFDTETADLTSMPPKRVTATINDDELEVING